MQDQETNLTQSPAVYGYAWVEHSNEASQMLDIQIQTLRKNNVKGELIFTDIVGSPFEVRPGWQSLSKKLNPGDKVYITPGPWQSDSHLQYFYLDLDLCLRIILSWQGVKVVTPRPTKDSARPFTKAVGRPRALDEHKVLECRKMRKKGASLRKIAEKMGCAPGTVKNILDGMGPYAEERFDV